MFYIAIFVYATAMTAANLSVATFGAWVSPINAFLFIGLDLTIRDLLHSRLSAWKMGALIVGTGVITYALSPAAGMIAVASAAAFTAAAVVDWSVFCRVKGSWLTRTNTSNTAGALIDSIIFPTLAFGVLLPHIIAVQFVAKISGGAVWAWVFNRSQIAFTKEIKKENINESV
jgi:uncharacterized PurR-regulated membrane protein YhhQ (DUF165 family)